MKQSEFLAHDALQSNAERKDAMKRALLARAKRAPEPLDSAPREQRRAMQLLAYWCGVLAACAIVACDVFIWRP